LSFRLHNGIPFSLEFKISAEYTSKSGILASAAYPPKNGTPLAHTLEQKFKKKRSPDGLNKVCLIMHDDPVDMSHKPGGIRDEDSKSLVFHRSGTNHSLPLDAASIHLFVSGRLTLCRLIE
jgi:hypothetical protein